MDHQVQDHAHVRVAAGMGCQPVRFDETRLFGDAFEKFENRVETFDVANLYQAAFALGQSHQFTCLLHVFGNWFLDEEMLALLQQLSGYREMRDGGSNNIQRITRGCRFINPCKRACAVFLRKTARHSGILIENACKLHGSRRRHLGVNARMMLSQ